MSIRRPLMLAFLLTLACAAGCSDSTGAGGDASCPRPDLLGFATFDSVLAPVSNWTTTGWVIMSPEGGGAIASDPSQPGNKAFRVPYHYQPGTDQGTSPNAIFELTPQTRVFAHFRFKLDSGMDVGGIKKMFRLRAQHDGEILGGFSVLWGRFIWGLDGMGPGQYVYANTGSGEILPADWIGHWHTVDVSYDLAPSATSVAVRVWLDGALKFDYPHLATIDHSGLRISSASFGGTFNDPGANTVEWLDDLAVSTSCIAVK